MLRQGLRSQQKPRDKVLETEDPDAPDPEALPKIHCRILPVSPSYFTGRANFTDSLLSLRDVLRRHATIATVKQGEQPRMQFQDLVQYRNQVGETIPNRQYTQISAILKRLNMIKPALRTPEVIRVLDEHKKQGGSQGEAESVIEVDKHGRARGLGKRKSASGRAWLVEGTGEVYVNGKPLTEAFARIHDRESVLWALKATDRMNKYNIWGRCQGGGTTGQAEALALAVSKALVGHEPALKPALRRAGLITSDPRQVERKKPGRLKARKKPQWVKR